MSMNRSKNDHEDWLAIIDESLARNPDILALLFDRSVTLEELGRYSEAEEACRLLLEKDPEHYWGRTRLARILMQKQRYTEAFNEYMILLERDPDDALIHAQIAGIVALSGDFHVARFHYNRAIELSPHNTHAHHGLSLILEELGELEAATYHRDLSRVKSGYYTMQFRGKTPPIPLLLLVAASEGSGSMTFERLIDNKIFQTSKLVLETCESNVVLPASALIINGICDVERAEPALRKAQKLLKNVTVPLINRVESLLHTGRAENAARLRQITNVRTPRTAIMTKLELRLSDRAKLLEEQGFFFPLLVRAPGFFAGQQFHKVDRLSDLDQALDLMSSDTCIVIEYIDTRDSNGVFRKFRTLFINRELYPLHLALSDSWKVHYFNALMSSNAEFRAIEEAFLRDHQAFLGPKVIQAIREIECVLDLDYGGVDFGFDRDGTLVVYEANAGMSLALPGNDPMWAYRQPAADAVLKATEEMLLQRRSTTD